MSEMCYKCWMNTCITLPDEVNTLSGCLYFKYKKHIFSRNIYNQTCHWQLCDISLTVDVLQLDMFISTVHVRFYKWEKKNIPVATNTPAPSHTHTHTHARKYTHSHACTHAHTHTRTHAHTQLLKSSNAHVCCTFLTTSCTYLDTCDSLFFVWNS